MHRIYFRASGPSGQRQRGSIVLQACVTLIVCVIALTGVELGYLFFVKREMQKAADLSALAGAKVLATGTCAAGTAATNSYAVENLKSLNFPLTVTPVCGRWDSASSMSKHFDPASTLPNAMDVMVSGAGPSLLPFLSSRFVSAQAMAKSGPPLAGFSVGSKLVTVTGNGLLGDSLKLMGLDLTGTLLVGYDGLANVKITPGGLLKQLGIPASGDLTIGGLNNLLTANNVSLGQMLDATAVIAGQPGLLQTNVFLVNAITSKAGGSLNQVKLGSDSSGTSRGLFANVVSSDTSSTSALSAEVSALDIIAAAIGVATATHSVDASITVPGLGVKAIKVAVVEPPSIAFGGVGVKAYTAQIRSFIQLGTADLMLGTVLSNLVVLDLPIVIDIVSGKGTLTDLCTSSLRDSTDNDRASIEVDSSIAKVCIGKIDPANLYSKSKVCEENLANQPLLTVAGVAVAKTAFTINALAHSEPIVLKEGETKSTLNDLPIGTTVSDLMGKVIGQIFGASAPSGASTSAQAQTLAQKLYDDTVGLCAPSDTCRTARLNAVTAKIQSTTASSGLLTGVLNLLNSLLNPVVAGVTCTSFLGNDTGCVSIIKDSLASTSTAVGGVQVANTASTLAGLVKPLLNSLGNSVLTPLLNNVLGIQLGVTDVKLIKLQCSGESRLVY